MIEFRQKIFVAGAVAGIGKILSSNALMGGTMVGGMVQSSNQAKQQAKQNEEMMEQQQRLQKQTQKALEKVANAAKKDPSKAEAVAEVMQRSYSIPVAKLGTALKKGGQTVYEFGRALNNTGGGNQVAKKVGSGLAMGATMAVGSYALDKAIQADRKRITGGAPLPQPQEDPKKKSKGIRKAVTGAALVAGSVLAARKGYLGKGFENLSHFKNSAGQKLNLNPAKKVLGKELKSGLTGKAALGGLGFAGLLNAGYIGERKQLKDQARAQGEQKQYSENYQYQVEQRERKRGSALKKLAIGTAATLGTVATLRRVGPVGIRKGINDMYMTYGKKIAGKNGNKVGNWMMKSGSEEYGKAIAKQAQNKLGAVVSSGKKAAETLADTKALQEATKNLSPEKAAKYTNSLKTKAANVSKAEASLKNFNPTEFARKAGDSRLKAVQSGAVSRRLGQGVLSGISKMWTGGNSREVTGFLHNVANKKDAAGRYVNSKTTRDMASWLEKHKRTALVGSIGVGSIAFKPFEWGDKAVRGATRAVDKNAFAYEKSKEQQVQ